MRQLPKPVAGLMVGLSLIASLLVFAVATTAPAAADQTQVTILEDDARALANPVAFLTQMRSLGVTVLRFRINWGEIAPHTTSLKPPHFNQSDPAAYPAANWAPYDAVIREAKRLGITVDLNVAGGAPAWATGPGQPRIGGYPFGQWEPNAADFGQFVKAVGTRYDGDFNPATGRVQPGNANDLPRISFWSIWNEPDYGPSLAPQRLPGHPGVQYSPLLYRRLVDQAWNGLAASGHPITSDTIIIGELAPRSELTTPTGFADFNGITPVSFLQNLYCETAAYRPLTGEAARLRGCPTTAAARRVFAKDNPALFKNSGIADHPYSEWFAPTVEENVPSTPGYSTEVGQFASLATISNLVTALNRLPLPWGSHAQLPIWDTEYGYITSPPHRPSVESDHHPWPNQATAALYDNWAEYLSWKNPRIKSFAQYLLQDAVAATPANDYGSFASGIINFNGTIKGDYGPFRMPLYLPQQTISSPYATLEVWGGVRTSTFASIDEPSRAETVTLQFEPEGTRSWSTLGVEPISPEGYFDVHIAFPSSGHVRAEYTVPADSLLSISGTTIYSREVQITVH